MATPIPLAFLFDVDNTLLANDRVRRELMTTIESLVGPRRAQRFWELYEDVRQDCDFVDFPRTLGRFSSEFPDEPRTLAAVRKRLGDRVATLHVCQGKYAHAREHDEFPPADRTVAAIADILDLDLSTYLENRP